MGTAITDSLPRIQRSLILATPPGPCWRRSGDLAETWRYPAPHDPALIQRCRIPRRWSSLERPEMEIANCRPDDAATLAQWDADEEWDRRALRFY